MMVDDTNTQTKTQASPDISTRKSRKRPPRYLVLALILVLSGIGVYLAWRYFSKPVDRDQELVSVERSRADIKVVATGIIRPIREVKISPKTTGLLRELLVKQGDMVKQGQIIARMDDSNLLGQVKSARGAYLAAMDNYEKSKNGNRPQEIAASQATERKAREALRNAGRNIGRLRAQMGALTATLKRDQNFASTQAFLAASGAISEQDAINAETQAQVSKAQLEAANRELEQAQLSKAQAEADLEQIHQQAELMKAGFRKEDIAQALHNAEQAQGSYQQVESLLRDTQIRAPFDGVITQKYAEAGAIVTPTTSAATTSATSSSIVALAGTLEMVAQVSEANITKIKVGQPVEIIATALPDQTFRGRVTQIAPAAIVTANVTTFEVHADIDADAARHLLSGMNVSAQFIVGVNENALLVPSVCIVSRRGQTGVFVPDEKTEPKFVPVKTGSMIGRDTIVLSRLKQGDKVFKGLSKEFLIKEGYSGGGTERREERGRGRGRGGGAGGPGGFMPRMGR